MNGDRPLNGLMKGKGNHPRAPSSSSGSGPEKKVQDFRLMVDPALKHGQKKQFRFDGVMAGETAPLIPRDPRSKASKSWIMREPGNLPVPNFKYDENYVGVIMPREVTFTNLNNNIGEVFLRDMCEEFGAINEIIVFYHPKTRRHLGIASVLFSSTKASQRCVERLNNVSKMGNIMKVFIDTLGKERCKLIEELTADASVAPPPTAIPSRNPTAVVTPIPRSVGGEIDEKFKSPQGVNAPGAKQAEPLGGRPDTTGNKHGDPVGMGDPSITPAGDPSRSRHGDPAGSRCGDSFKTKSGVGRHGEGTRARQGADPSEASYNGCLGYNNTPGYETGTPSSGGRDISTPSNQSEFSYSSEYSYYHPHQRPTGNPDYHDGYTQPGFPVNQQDKGPGYPPRNGVLGFTNEDGYMGPHNHLVQDVHMGPDGLMVRECNVPSANHGNAVIYEPESGQFGRNPQDIERSYGCSGRDRLANQLLDNNGGRSGISSNSAGRLVSPAVRDGSSSFDSPASLGTPVERRLNHSYKENDWQQEATPTAHLQESDRSGEPTKAEHRHRHRDGSRRKHRHKHHKHRHHRKDYQYEDDFRNSSDRTDVRKYNDNEELEQAAGDESPLSDHYVSLDSRIQDLLQNSGSGMDGLHMADVAEEEGGEPPLPPQPTDSLPPPPPDYYQHDMSEMSRAHEGLVAPPPEEEEDDRMSLSSLSSGEEKLEVMPSTGVWFQGPPGGPPPGACMDHLGIPLPDHFGPPGHSSVERIGHHGPTVCAADHDGGGYYGASGYPGVNGWEEGYEEVGEENGEGEYIEVEVPPSQEELEEMEKFEKAFKQSIREVKDVMAKDLRKKMVENTGFKAFESWWRANENLEKQLSAPNLTSVLLSPPGSEGVGPYHPPSSLANVPLLSHLSLPSISLTTTVSTATASSGATVTTSTSTETTTTTTMRSTEGMSSALAALFTRQDSRQFGGSFGGGGGLLGLRGAIPKMPSFRRKVVPPSPPRVDEEDEEEDDDDDEDEREEEEEPAVKGPRTPAGSEEEEAEDKPRSMSSERLAASDEDEEEERVGSKVKSRRRTIYSSSSEGEEEESSVVRDDKSERSQSDLGSSVSDDEVRRKRHRHRSDNEEEAEQEVSEREEEEEEQEQVSDAESCVSRVKTPGGTPSDVESPPLSPAILSDASLPTATATEELCSEGEMSRARKHARHKRKRSSAVGEESDLEEEVGVKGRRKRPRRVSSGSEGERERGKEIQRISSEERERGEKRLSVEETEEETEEERRRRRRHKKRKRRHEEREERVTNDSEEDNTVTTPYNSPSRVSPSSDHGSTHHHHRRHHHRRSKPISSPAPHESEDESLRLLSDGGGARDSMDSDGARDESRSTTSQRLMECFVRLDSKSVESTLSSRTSSQSTEHPMETTDSLVAMDTDITTATVDRDGSSPEKQREISGDIARSENLSSGKDVVKEETKLETSKRSLSDVTNKSSSRGCRELSRLFIDQPPSVIEPRPQFSARDIQTDWYVRYDFLNRGLDSEDAEYLRRRYEALLQLDVLQTRWLGYTHWVDQPILLSPSDLIRPNEAQRTKRKKKSQPTEETISYDASATCARTTVYQKMTYQEKRGYLRHTRGVTAEAPLSSSDHRSTNTNELTLGQQLKRKVQQASREARCESRRWQSYFSSMGEDTGELVKVNLLKFLQKQLKFARSDIHEWGLFALEKIPEGEMVIEYVGQVIRQSVADTREKRYEAKGIGSSYLFRIDSDAIVDATMFGNSARFINHCCNPNCCAKIVTVDNQKKIVIYSRRAIAENEEITYDYKFPLEEEKIPCLCGAVGCKGTLN